MIKNKYMEKNVLPQEIITKKRVGQTLDDVELEEFFLGYIEGRVTDYQMSAMLMAIYFQGMDLNEILKLTTLSRNSGTIFNWEGIDANLIIDKHSTGGVGDKTSLILSPLCILEGLKVPMISGRSLGHTGGTVDKLESVPGMNMNLSIEKANSQLRNFGGFMMCQTQDLAPLDKRLYALRDSCSIVNSPALVVSSILSKKLAEGLSGLVMDIKFGSGAFFTEQDEAEKLAIVLKEVAIKCDLSVKILLSSMNSPLGRYAGNALEVYECVQVLQNNGPLDTAELSLELAAEMVHLAFPKRDHLEIKKSLIGHLQSGRAFETFCELMSLQGADISYLLNSDKLVNSEITEAVYADQEGFISHCDVKKIGMGVNILGGGRSKMGDSVDHRVGFSELKHKGERMTMDTPLAIIHGNNLDKINRVKTLVKEAYTLSPTPLSSKESLIWKKF